MSAPANWQGRDGLSADCTLARVIAMATLMSNEHPCDRCNMNRDECRGYPPKPGHTARMEASNG